MHAEKVCDSWNYKACKESQSELVFVILCALKAGGHIIILLDLII